MGSLAVLAQQDAPGVLPEVTAGASWPEYPVQRMGPEPGGRVVVILGKELPEAELPPARTPERELVSARTYQRLGADRQVAVLTRAA